jgi:hypothetical protein
VPDDCTFFVNSTPDQTCMGGQCLPPAYHNASYDPIQSDSQLISYLSVTCVANFNTAPLRGLLATI